ncbi:MAG TPA: hypothetical protein EYP90_05510 [Chromatiaceae bacterium]|nr:hypothetical protein [Chromatiaceae bacterium]
MEDVTTARALANRMFYAGAGLMGIGAAMTMYNERATFSSAGEPWQDLAFTRHSSSLYYFNAAFGHVEDESTYYPAMALVLALGSVEALAPEAMRVLATADRFNSMMPVATRVSESRLIAQLTMDLEEAEDVEENREYIEGLRADLQEAQDVLREFNSSYQERVRQQVERETHFFRLVADMRTDDTFGDSPALTRGTESGYILADSLLDPRFRRMEIPTMSTRVDPFVTPLDTNTDQQIRPHRRIAEHFIDRAGHVFGELERQARIRQDTTAPDVLRTDLPHLNLTEFQQLDLNALQTAMQEMSEAYGSAVPYAQVTAMGNRILMQVLDGRIEQLQLLLERTRRPPADQAQQRRYYDIAQRALRDARSLRRAFGNTTSTAQMSRDMFSRRIFEGSPTEAIAMAELGLVQLSRVTGFGTHAPAAVPDFRRFLTGRARASILAAHPDQYRITLPVHALTSEGMMPLEEFDTRLQRAGQPPVPRDVHFLLFESIPGSPNRHLLRNPRYTEGGTEPEYIGIADTSTGSPIFIA